VENYKKNQLIISKCAAVRPERATAGRYCAATAAADATGIWSYAR